MNFKKLLAKIVNLIFKYILSSYFIECDWRCSKEVTKSELMKRIVLKSKIL